MLNRDHKIILETKNEMLGYYALTKKAGGQWLKEILIIWYMKKDYDRGNVITRFEAYLQDLNIVERKLSLTIKPVSLERTFRFDHV
jgi:hypothetical protein